MDEPSSSSVTSVSRSQFIIWMTSVVSFFMVAIVGAYLIIDSRVRALELDAQVLKTKYEQYDKFINEIRLDIREINDAIHNIDLKITPMSKK